ncbi:hypothetical protein TrCOL_g786 [Triparma columacea]|uniref:Uncharacterized protein n=1 Tax=Triparma columacea TaxID=722753 RepID=A0A9W7G576_9STRA|nr:hypothetical protein TrCOL_g786 [Triparma columacea]
MKLIILLTLPLLTLSYTINQSAKHPSSSTRKAFLTTLTTALVSPLVANAMDQELILDPTEVWETGKPTGGKAARDARYKNARNQLNSNFAPQKRLTLERKSPVTRLDLNGPNFTGYQGTYPGLFEKKGKKTTTEVVAKVGEEEKKE